MSLDKWIKPEEEKEEEKEGKDEEEQNEITDDKSEEIDKKRSQTPKLKKYHLKCPKKSCKYQKTLMKNNLSEKDKTCPRCKSEMKVKVK
jgi:hypothetical protein